MIDYRNTLIVALFYSLSISVVIIILLSKEEQSYYDQNVFFEDFINNHSKQPYSEIFISDKSCEDKEVISFLYPGYKEKCEEKKCL